MHEMSIAQNIVEVVLDYLPAGTTAPVRTVRLRIGELANVVPESLEFCFHAIADRPPLAGAKLVMERIPVRVACDECSALTIVQVPMLRCGSCGSPDVQVVSGTELQVSEIELDDEAQSGDS